MLLLSCWSYLVIVIVPHFDEWFAFQFSFLPVLDYFVIAVLHWYIVTLLPLSNIVKCITESAAEERYYGQA